MCFIKVVIKYVSPTSDLSSYSYILRKYVMKISPPKGISGLGGLGVGSGGRGKHILTLSHFAVMAKHRTSVSRPNGFLFLFCESLYLVLNLEQSVENNFAIQSASVAIINFNIVYVSGRTQ